MSNSDDATDRPFALSEVLPYVIVRVAARLDRRFDALMAAEGFTVRLFGILSQFSGGRTRTAAEIARSLGVTPQSVGPPIEDLVGRGLLARTQGAGRGRPVHLSLTAAGESRVAGVLALARDEDERLTGGLSARRKREMFDGLREIAAALDDVDA